MTYAEKKEAMKVKYSHAINAISLANDVDLGVAFDMLDANVLRNGKYTFVNEQEYAIDSEELQKIAAQ